MKRRATGGVFRQLDEMLERFEADKKRFRAAVKERLGSPRALRVDDVFFLCVWKGTKYRALSVDALLEKLPKREATPAGGVGE